MQQVAAAAVLAHVTEAIDSYQWLLLCETSSLWAVKLNLLEMPIYAHWFPAQISWSNAVCVYV